MYKWDMEEVKKEIAKHKKLWEKASLEEEEERIQGTIYSYQELQEYYNLVIRRTGAKKTSAYYVVESSPNFKDVVYDDLTILRRYGIYCPIVRNFVSLFSWQTISREEPLNKLSTTPEGIVTSASQYYQNSLDFFRDNYRKLAEHFNSRLAFVNLDKEFDCSGFTHPIYETDRIYIDVGRNNTLQDYTSFFHESSHGITLEANPGIIWDSNKYGFLEVDSLFFEMVGSEYMSEVLHREEDYNKLRRAVFIDYLYNADILCSKFDLYSALSSKDLKDKRKVKEYLKSEEGYDKDFINDTCNTYLSAYLNYIVSYLTAIELYLIYKVDKDYALELLQKIIMLKDLSIKGYMDKIKELGVEPGKNITQYFEMIAPKGGFGYVKRI